MGVAEEAQGDVRRGEDRAEGAWAVIEPLLSDDALLADIDAARRANRRALHVWWLGQSGYLACSGDRSAVAGE